MSEAIIVALITGACAIAAQLIISRANSREMYARLDKAQAVTDTKIDELTREVRAHNNFAERIPVLEEKIKVANNRIKNLEGSGHNDAD